MKLPYAIFFLGTIHNGLAYNRKKFPTFLSRIRGDAIHENADINISISDPPQEAPLSPRGGSTLLTEEEVVNPRTSAPANIVSTSNPPLFLLSQNITTTESPHEIYVVKRDASAELLDEDKVRLELEARAFVGKPIVHP